MLLIYLDKKVQEKRRHKMTSSFCYTFDKLSKKKFLKFRSGGCEEYIVIHELTRITYGNSINLNIAVECNVQKDVLVTAEVCSSGNITFKTTSLLTDCRAKLNYQNIKLTADPWRCVISVIPHLQLQEIQESGTPVAALRPGKRSIIKRAKLEQLSADMQRILSTGELSDFILSDGCNKFHAHKVILSARSPVFAKMFHHPMKENAENCVTISDIPEDALKELVSFIYTGNVTLKDNKMARNLYIAADKYALTDLRKLCSDVMQNVSADDVLETLALADLYEDKTLKLSALDFITRNYSHMKKTKEWEAFMKENQALAIETLSFIIEKKA